MDSLHSSMPWLAGFMANSLRLPGVVILELWCRIFWENSEESSALQEKLQNNVRTWMRLLELPQMIKARNLDVVLDQMLMYSVLVFGVTFVILPPKKLVSIYLHVASVLLLGVGYYLSYRYVQVEQESGEEQAMLDDFPELERHGFHFLSQVMLAALVSCLLSLPSVARICLTAFAAPIVARLCGFPVQNLHVVHNFSSCFIMMLICFYSLALVPHVSSMLRTFEQSVKSLVQARGLLGTSIVVWRQLDLPLLLAMFWLVSFTTEAYAMYTTGGQDYKKMVDESPYGQLELNSWYVRLLLVLSSCCKTPLSLLAFCAAVAYFSRTTLLGTRYFVCSDGEGVPATRLDLFHGGYAEAFTLLLLAFQTELIERSTLERALLILIILFIVFSSLLQSVFDVMEPVLLRVSATRLTDIVRHAKVLFICFLLFVIPIGISTSIARLLPVDFWLSIIISSCVLTSVQTLGAVAIYALFAYDNWRRGPPWENLDDYVFVCRAITRVLEFLVAVFVIAYGGYESIFGEWSWINSSMLILHCYFNVWQRLQAGWKSFLLRRDAARKLDLLPMASSAQLHRLQDVCAICYQDMLEARVTPCNHFFHGTCLKKWLYVQQVCPMCNWDLSFKTTSTTSHRADSGRRQSIGEPEEGYSSDEYEMAETEQTGNF